MNFVKRNGKLSPKCILARVSTGRGEQGCSVRRRRAPAEFEPIRISGTADTILVLYSLGFDDARDPVASRCSGMRAVRIGTRRCRKAFAHAVMEETMVQSEGGQSPAERGVGIVVLIIVTP